MRVKMRMRMKKRMRTETLTNLIVRMMNKKLYRNSQDSKRKKGKHFQGLLQNIFFNEFSGKFKDQSSKSFWFGNFCKR